jgi:hypothetical protein
LDKEALGTRRKRYCSLDDSEKNKKEKKMAMTKYHLASARKTTCNIEDQQDECLKSTKLEETWYSILKKFSRNQFVKIAS